MQQASHGKVCATGFGPCFGTNDKCFVHKEKNNFEPSKIFLYFGWL